MLTRVEAAAKFLRLDSLFPQKVEDTAGMLITHCHLWSSTCVYLPTSGFAEERWGGRSSLGGKKKFFNSNLLKIINSAPDAWHPGLWKSAARRACLVLLFHPPYGCIILISKTHLRGWLSMQREKRYLCRCLPPPPTTAPRPKFKINPCSVGEGGEGRRGKEPVSPPL